MDADNVVQIEIATDFPEAEPVYDEADAAAVPEAEAEDPEAIAKSIIAKAKAEGDKILAKAKSDGEKAGAEAKAQGEAEAVSIKEKAQEDGYNEGMAQAQAEGQKIITEAEGVLSEAIAKRAELEESFEPDMVNLVMDIVKKLIGDTVELYPGTIVNLIKQGIESATLSGLVNIHVSPDDYQQVMEDKDSIDTFADSSVTIEIIKDPSLGKMDCVIETPFGNIDCSLNQQHDTIRDQLKYILSTRND